MVAALAAVAVAAAVAPVDEAGPSRLSGSGGDPIFVVLVHSSSLSSSHRCGRRRHPLVFILLVHLVLLVVLCILLDAGSY
jgi:hypothetical protein